MAKILELLAGSTATAIVAAIAFVLYLVGLAVYRLRYSPLAKFPGPKLAALTLWYEFYYDSIKRGRYSFEIEKMHREYGPIIRINPNELHINDPDYFDQLYGSHAKLDKYNFIARQFGNGSSTIATLPHELHKRRRAALAPFFARRQVVKLQGLITLMLEKVCMRFEEHKRNGKPLDVSMLFRFMTVDITTEYGWGKPYGFLDAPETGERWVKSMQGLFEMGNTTRQLPWLVPIFKAIPGWMNPGAREAVALIKTIDKEVLDIKQKSRKEFDIESKENPTIFHELFNSDLPEEEKSVDRLSQEGLMVVLAGAETVGNALSTMTYYLLENPQYLHKLKMELAEAIPNPAHQPTWQELEKLPYLSAVICEGLRVGLGVSARLPRVSPEQSLYYKDWEIPRGTPVSMNIMLMHHNPVIFPSPLVFQPDRWLDPETSPALQKYLVPFSKGTRMCLGMHLGYAELYLTMAAIYRNFDLRLYDTTREDVEPKHDFFVPVPELDTKGVRVLVK
ncbi:MAG: hypothetical protein M1819_001147 [Sarea resinae]|nr:MAG: hypothetical protein M1819_001147 [Sarea resinae]